MRTSTVQVFSIVALFVSVLCFVAWALIFYGAWFVPAQWVAYTMLLPALLVAIFIGWRKTDPRVLAVLPASARVDTPITRVGSIVFVSAFLWLGLAKTIPAVITDLIGEPTQSLDRVAAHYFASGTCGFRLVLDDTNPPWGGYCRVGDGAWTFTRGQEILLRGKRSVFGFLVEGFDMRANKAFQGTLRDKAPRSVPELRR